MLFRETFDHMLAVNSAMLILVADAEILVHAGDMDVVDENKSQKLKLIGQPPGMEDVVEEDAGVKIELASEEEFLYS